MKGIYRDLPKVYKKYLSLKEKYGIQNQKMPWEYVSLSTNFKENQTWDYYTGHVVTSTDKLQEDFINFEIPGGTYAIFPIKAKFKIMFGLKFGKMKKYIYQNWLPNSDYEFCGCEFEYNNESMNKENPNYIDLYVAIRKKDKFQS
jgi:predicted transcriptional regulator YdeE